MRVEKREFAWEFSQLSCPGQTRTTRDSWELMRVEKWEFAWEFSQLTWPDETRTRVAWKLMSWEARVCMRVFTTHMPRSNENKCCMRVDESWEATVCIKVFSTHMARSNENKCYTRVDENWEARVCMRVFSTHIARWNENKSCTRVDWILRENSHQYLNQLKVW
jgi:hypothetical protein